MLCVFCLFLYAIFTTKDLSQIQYFFHQVMVWITGNSYKVISSNKVEPAPAAQEDDVEGCCQGTLWTVLWLHMFLPSISAWWAKKALLRSIKNPNSCYYCWSLQLEEFKAHVCCLHCPARRWRIKEQAGEMISLLLENVDGKKGRMWLPYSLPTGVPIWISVRKLMGRRFML